MTGRHRRAAAGALASLSAALLVIGTQGVGASPADPQIVLLDISETYEGTGDGHTVTYTVTGVEVDPATDADYHHTGTVVGDTVSLSGSATFTIAEGYVTNLGMSASLSVAGGESVSDSWPPEGTDGRVGGTTVDFPFDLTVTIPPPPTTTTSPFGPDPFATDTTPGATTTTVPPYSTVSFSVRSQNCNDVGVCGGPVIDGSFAVFAPPTPPVDDSPDWLATVGALGAAAAAAAALAGSRSGRAGDRYVLQVSSDELVVTPTNPAGFQVQVWRVGPSGATMPAADATTHLVPTAGIRVAPTEGGSALAATVSTDGDVAGPGEATVEVRAEAGGGTMQATVRVHRGGAYDLELY